MTTGKKKGGKNYRKSKNHPISSRTRDLMLKEEGQLYGIVRKMLGDKRVLCMCSDNIERTCHIRGKFHKRVWIKIGDIVIISLRECEPDKADIIHKYSDDEGRRLIQQKEVSFDSEGAEYCAHEMEDIDNDSSGDEESLSDDNTDYIAMIENI